jgi:hypothetical protein
VRIAAAARPTYPCARASARSKRDRCAGDMKSKQRRYEINVRPTWRAWGRSATCPLLPHTLLVLLPSSLPPDLPSFVRVEVARPAHCPKAWFFKGVCARRVVALPRARGRPLWLRIGGAPLPSLRRKSCCLARSGRGVFYCGRGVAGRGAGFLRRETRDAGRRRAARRGGAARG